MSTYSQQALAWICYWTGHVTSMLLNVMPDSWPEWLHKPVYNAYQSLMAWSYEYDIIGSIWHDEDEADWV
jgi:hypothetical protein